MAAQVKQLETQLQQAHQQKVVSVQELHDKLEQLKLNYHSMCVCVCVCVWMGERKFVSRFIVEKSV